MTCRLRSNGPDDTGVAYKCGAEFPDQMVQEKCIPEGPRVTCAVSRGGKKRWLIGSRVEFRHWIGR